jgi:hypothetical protein
MSVRSVSRDSRFSLLRRSHLVDYENSCVAETFYYTWNKLPEQRDNRNSKVNTHVKLTFEQLAVGRGGDEVYPEPLGRGAANGFDFFTD